MDLRTLRCFLTVAEEGSITRAASRLHMSQPPLSVRLQALERELDVALLVRHGRGVELTAAGRPAILIPYPSATDDHQTANAREITKAGGARTIPQPEFTPHVLARQIEALAADPQALANAAARSLSVGRPRAASDLADLVERIGSGLAPIAVGPALTPRVKSRAGRRSAGVKASHLMGRLQK